MRQGPGREEGVALGGHVLEHRGAVDALEVVVGEAEEGVVVSAVVEEGLEAGELEAAGRLFFSFCRVFF